jgi:arabinose-5-phosphate isomerase
MGLSCSPQSRRRDDQEPEDRRGDQLVSEALELLNSSKITAVFVVDAGTPVGIVHLHDLLRAAR